MHRFIRLLPPPMSRLRRLAAAGGQGTVEYVALILLVAGVLGVVVSWGRSNDHQLGQKITDKLEESIDDVGKGKRSAATPPR